MTDWSMFADLDVRAPGAVVGVVSGGVCCH